MAQNHYDKNENIPSERKQCSDNTNDPSPTNAGDASRSTGSSTVISSGQFRLQIPLLSAGAFRVGAWQFGIEYLRHNGIDGVLGPNVNFTQNLHIENEDGDIVLVTADNLRERFEWNENSQNPQYSSELNNTAAVLTPSAPPPQDEFTLTSSRGIVTKFHGFGVAITTPGRIKSSTDRYGNTQVFVWTRNGTVDQLLEVTDGYGRKITYRYFGSEQGHRLREIEDFLGRKINFQYDSAGRLEWVITPSINKGSEGNTFPGGTAYVFQYDSQNLLAERRDDLIRVWYPNEATPYIDVETRTVDVARVYAEATPRYVVAYGQNPLDPDSYGRVVVETVGDPENGVGGHYHLTYLTDGLPENLIDPADPIVLEVLVEDRNGNQTIYDFNENNMPVRVAAYRCGKLTVDGHPLPNSYVTWTKYNAHNQPLLVIHPEGNSVEYEYDNGQVADWSGTYVKRMGLLLRETHRPGHCHIEGIPDGQRQGSSGQVELTWRYFYDPIYNQKCAVIERRGDPLGGPCTVTGDGGPTSPNGEYAENGCQNSRPAYEKNGGGFWLWWSGDYWIISVQKGTPGNAYWRSASLEGAYGAQGSATGTAAVDATYYVPQNLGTTPDRMDRSRYATITYPDYQKDTAATVSADTGLQELLALMAAEIQDLIAHVDERMKAGGLPDGFEMGLGDVNGDGTGVNTGHDAPHLGLAVKTRRPSVRQLVENTGGEPWKWIEPRPDSPVWLTCKLPHTTWEVGDDVQDNSGGTTWAGEILRRSAGGAAFLVELTTGTYSDVTVATDGVNNTTRSETDDLIAKARFNEIAELSTYNGRGQLTTHTCPEGNLTVHVRYPFYDPEGTGRILDDLSSVGPDAYKQYGFVRETHRDADPDDVMSLVGTDGDLVDFSKDVYPRCDRTNTEGACLDLATRWQGPGGGEGCCVPAYDASGNVLAETNARGFTTTYDRNEVGQVYRVTQPGPYSYRKETHYDANGNVIREDVEDKGVAFASDDPTDPEYAKFVPTGSGYTAHVPTKAGPGGAIRPGWFTNLYEYDLLDNRVKEDLDATGSTPDRLVTTFVYDANQNLIRITKPEGNTVEHDYDERNLRIATRVGCDPATGEPGAVTITVYDGNGNVLYEIGATDRLGIQGPTSLTATLDAAFHTSGDLTHRGDWVLENVYDGFDRVIKTIDAVGNVIEHEHDPDGRVTRTVRKGPVGGPMPENREGTDNVVLADVRTRYDEAGQAYEGQQQAFVSTGADLESSRTVTQVYGGLAANSTTDRSGSYLMVDGGTAQGPSDESYVLRRNVYDRAGRLVVAAQDNTGRTHFEFDGVGNQVRVTDAQGQEGGGIQSNVVENTFDGSGNLVHVVRRENATIADPPGGNQPDAEVFKSSRSYDALNRLVLSAEKGADGTLADDLVGFCASPSGGQTILARFGYDSRGNQTVIVDSKGNTAVTAYDGAGRATEGIRHLRRGGDGESPPEGGTFEAEGGASVRTRTVYDGNGRPTELVDDRGGRTAYAYDTLDRSISMVFHDGSTRKTEYNEAGDITRYTDENQSEFVYTHDALGRRVGAAITPAANVAGYDGDGTRGTVSRTFQYDGLGRMTLAVDKTQVDGADDQSAAAESRYDSSSRLVEGKQTHDLDGAGNEKTRYVTCHAFASLVPSGLTYPNDRQVVYDHDILYRRTSIAEGGSSIAHWSFFGPERVAELKLGEASQGNSVLVCTHLNNDRTKSAVQDPGDIPEWGNASSDRLGYDGAGRMITKRYLHPALDPNGHYADTAAVVGFTTAYDLASNKVYERHLLAENRSHLYPGLDSMNRLRQYQRGTLHYDETTGAVTVQTPITLPGTDQDRTYDLDGLGNWRRTDYTRVLTPTMTEDHREVRQHNYLNQITRFDGTPVSYDHGNNTGDEGHRGNGNIVDDGTRLYMYDALNRLKEVRKKDGGARIATYTYDALGRRIRKLVENGGILGDPSLDGTTDYLYTGVRCIEERDLAGAPPPDAVLRHYVWGQYVDELIQQREFDGSPTDYYLLSDLLYRSVALVDTSAAFVEVYDTDAYGNTLVFSGPGPNAMWFTEDDETTDTATCRFVFTGREYDAETQIYCYRARYYIPAIGRFLSRDPAGHADGLNGYQYAGGNPGLSLDSPGTATITALPDRVDSCRWHDKSLPGDAVGLLAIFPFPRPLFSFKCSPGPKCEGFTLSCNIIVSMAIFVDVQKAESRGADKAGVYGHEQRHLNALQKNLGKYVVEEEKKTYPDLASCKAAARDAESKFQGAFQANWEMWADNKHQDKGEFPKGGDAPYPPIGTMPPPQPGGRTKGPSEGVELYA